MAKKILKIRPSCLFLPNMSIYRRDFDKTKWLSFLIKDDKLLEKYNEILEKKVSNIIKKEFDKKPVHNKKNLQIKIKFYNVTNSTLTIIKY